MNLQIDFQDLIGVRSFLSGIQDRFTDLRKFWADYVVPYTHDEIDEIFDTQGHGQWDDLNPIYAARKAITHPGQPILRRDDTYYKAATTSTHADSVTDIDPLALVLGVSTPHARFHEEGRGVPQRAVYELIPTLLSFDRDLSELGEDYTQDVLNNLERFVRL